MKTSGFEAIVIQHEIDHLDGKVFLDRVISLKWMCLENTIKAPIA
ncbi:MAG: peptide deformylase [Endomicrobium sp.]|nr:peptide deformylase [Endomicrobium sp.]